MERVFYCSNENYVLRRIHGTFFLIDITDNYCEDKCRLIELNEMSAFIWDSIKSDTSVEAVTGKLIGLLCEKVNYEEVIKDVTDCLETFVKWGIANKR